MPIMLDPSWERCSGAGRRTLKVVGSTPGELCHIPADHRKDEIDFGNTRPTRRAGNGQWKRVHKHRTTCPKCKSQPQTLGHVLNACTPNTGLLRKRHNAVLQRLSKAISVSEGDKYLEQKVKNAPGDLRPDMVLWHSDGKVTIVDVTIPYEGDKNAFVTARCEKKTKYQPVVDWLVANGHPNVQVDAFIVGSLGSWDTDNEDVMKRLRIGTKYANLFRKLCVVDAIKGSLAIEMNVWK